MIERETSSEQLIRRRDTRCLKGLELSQRVALCRAGGLEQGSFDVGRFRDCRALSCFGSRVEDDNGVEGVDGVGEDKGEGDLLGEMDADRECIGMKKKKKKGVRTRKMVKNGVGFMALLCFEGVWGCFDSEGRMWKKRN